MPPWRRPGAAGYSGQGEPHLVPGHAAVVGGGQALVDEPQARVEGHEVVEAGEHQALATVDARRLDDGAQQSGGQPLPLAAGAVATPKIICQGPSGSCIVGDSYISSVRSRSWVHRPLTSASNMPPSSSMSQKWSA